MYIVVDNKKLNINVYNTFFPKLIGLMFKKKIENPIYLSRTKSIHTFFMKTNIDIIFTKNNKIIKIYIDVSPNKILINKYSNGVIELPANTLKKNSSIKIIS